MREDFLHEIFTQLLCNQIYTKSQSLVEIYWKMTNLCYFNQYNPPFFSIPSIMTRVVCWCLWKEPVCWWWDEDADSQTDRVIAGADRSDCHWQPQPRRHSSTWWRSPPPCSRVLVASLPKWSAKWLSTHQLSYASAGVYDTFQHDAPDVTVQWVQIWELEGHSVFSMNLFAFSLLCMTITHWGRRVVWLKQHNFVIFRYISTKLSGKVYIWLFNSHVKFHAKICTHCWNTNKSHRGGLLFCVRPAAQSESVRLSVRPSLTLVSHA